VEGNGDSSLYAWIVYCYHPTNDDEIQVGSAIRIGEDYAILASQKTANGAGIARVC
jgi:hypothetical protein